MATSVRIEKRLADGRILFCKDGVYFALTTEQVQQLYDLTFPKKWVRWLHQVRRLIGG